MAPMKDMALGYHPKFFDMLSEIGNAQLNVFYSVYVCVCVCVLPFTRLPYTDVVYVALPNSYSWNVICQFHSFKLHRKISII